MISQVLFFIAAVCLIIVVVVLLIMLANNVHAQDIDPRYVCLYKDQYPYNELCRLHEQQDIIDFLNNNTELWK